MASPDGRFPLFVAAPLVFAAGCLTDNPAPRHPPAPPETEPVQATPAPMTAQAPKACPAGTRPAQDGLIDDLEDGDTRSAPFAGRTGYWWLAKADHAVVTTPAGGFASSDGGADGSKKAVRFAGKTDAADQWGATVGVSFLESGFYDASKYAGVTFRIKAMTPGTNVRVKLPDASTHPDAGVCSACWNAFGKDLVVSTEWQEMTLPWSELTQQPDWGAPRPPSITPAKLHNIEWAVPQGVEFDFVVDDIRFIECA